MSLSAPARGTRRPASDLATLDGARQYSIMEPHGGLFHLPVWVAALAAGLHAARPNCDAHIVWQDGRNVNPCIPAMALGDVSQCAGATPQPIWPPTRMPPPARAAHRVCNASSSQSLPGGALRVSRPPDLSTGQQPSFAGASPGCEPMDRVALRLPASLPALAPGVPGSHRGSHGVHFS